MSKNPHGRILKGKPKEQGKKLENNTKFQTISLVSNVFKLFRKLTSRV